MSIELHMAQNIGTYYFQKVQSVSSGSPNTEKQMKARGRRPSAFIVARCLETPMKHELEFWK